MSITNTTVSTKVNATDKAATETALTIDWSNVTNEDIRALAQQALIVKWQARVRKAGTIPTEATIDVGEYKVGARAPRGPVDVAALLQKMDPDALAAVLKKAGLA